MRRLTIFFLDPDAAHAFARVPHLLDGTVDLERPATAAAGSEVSRYRGVSVVVSDAAALRIRAAAAARPDRLLLGPIEPLNLEELEELLDRRGVATLEAGRVAPLPLAANGPWRRPTWQGRALLRADA